MKEHIEESARPKRSISQLVDLLSFLAGERHGITHRIRITVHRVECAGTSLFKEITTLAMHRAHPL